MKPKGQLGGLKQSDLWGTRDTFKKIYLPFLPPPCPETKSNLEENHTLFKLEKCVLFRLHQELSSLH